jgi:hypothetical protein
MDKKTADDKQSFKLPSIFFILNKVLPAVCLNNRRCMQFADSACKLIERVTDYLMQQHLKLFEPF